MQSINTRKLSIKRTLEENKSYLSTTRIEAWLNIILVTWSMLWRIISRRFFWILTMLTTISTVAMCICTRQDSSRNMRSTLKLMKTLIQLSVLTLIMQSITMRKDWSTKSNRKSCAKSLKNSTRKMHTFNRQLITSQWLWIAKKHSSHQCSTKDWCSEEFKSTLQLWYFSQMSFACLKMMRLFSYRGVWFTKTWEITIKQSKISERQLR